VKKTNQINYLNFVQQSSGNGQAYVEAELNGIARPVCILKGVFHEIFRVLF
jgi:hypothetical protein